MKGHSLKYDIIAILDRSHADGNCGIVKILFYYETDNPNYTIKKQAKKISSL